MTRSTRSALRLIGAFALEVNAGRPTSACVRSKKGRALLAYLAMKPGYRAGREELATLFWGDNPDAQARHSLRQCLTSLRSDLRPASGLLTVDRETIALCPQGLTVDAREFMALARSGREDDLDRAAGLWRGEFLADLTLDSEEFDAWLRRERDRLADVAGHVMERMCRNADAAGDGERAVEAAERLVALDPMREDRQRTALRIYARHRGRDAALARAKQLTDLLHEELGVEAEQDTRVLIDSIGRDELKPAPLPARPPSAAAESADLVPEEAAPQRAADDVLERPNAVVPVAASPGSDLVPFPVPRRRVRPIAAALAAMMALAVGTATVLATGAMAWFHRSSVGPAAAAQASAAYVAPTRIVVLPFAFDAPRDAADRAFAQSVGHDLIGYLARFPKLRIISNAASDTYRGRPVDLARIGSELNVTYAILGRVQRNGGGLRVSFNLVDTATQLNVWSNDVQREDGDLDLLADEVARGIARPFAITIANARAQNQKAGIDDLLARARLAAMHGYLRDNAQEALRLYELALLRAPENLTAMLGVARMSITARMNFLDLNPQPDLARAERLLNEVLAKSPASLGAHYALGLLQKRRGQFQASLHSFARCLELNPSFLPAQGQIAAIHTRLGQPQKALDLIQDTLRVAAPNDPTTGFWYLFAGEAELELGHEREALDFMQRADAFMPNTPLVYAWLASVYATMGDRPNAARYAAALRRMSPAGTQQFMTLRAGASTAHAPGPRIFHGLRLALGGSLG